MTRFTNQQLKRRRVHSSFTKAFPVYKYLIKSTWDLRGDGRAIALGRECCFFFSTDGYCFPPCKLVLPWRKQNERTGDLC